MALPWPRSIIEMASPWPELRGDEHWDARGSGTSDARSHRQQVPYELSTPDPLATWDMVARRISQGHPPSYQSLANENGLSAPEMQSSQDGSSISEFSSDPFTRTLSPVSAVDNQHTSHGQNMFYNRDLDALISPKALSMDAYSNAVVGRRQQVSPNLITDAILESPDDCLQPGTSSSHSFASHAGPGWRHQDTLRAKALNSPFKALPSVHEGHRLSVQTAKGTSPDIDLLQPSCEVQGNFRLEDLVDYETIEDHQDQYQYAAAPPASTPAEQSSTSLSSPSQSMSSSHRTSTGESNRTGPTPPTSTEVSPLSNSAQSTFATFLPPQPSQIRGITQCPECPTEFTGSFQDRRSNLKRHIKYCHGQQGKFRCPGCSKEYSRPDNLTKHRRTVHQDIPKPQRSNAHRARRSF
ncbi:MAG: hypothetical protein Q9222_006850 [Ikaeria aurantiellina]